MRKFNKTRPHRNPLKTTIAFSLVLLSIFCSQNEGGVNEGGVNEGGVNEGGVSEAETIKHTLRITKPTNGTLSSNAGGINCGGESTACKADFNKGVEVTLTAQVDKGYMIGNWSGTCLGLEETCTLVMDKNRIVELVFFLLDNDFDGIPDIDDPDDDNDTVLDETDVDDDNDGLIEIHNLELFDNIRHNLAGTSYKTASDAEDNRMGAPEAATNNCTKATMDGGKSVYLCGYELARDLDFAQGDSYATGSVKADWRPLNASNNIVDAKDAINAGFTGPNDFASIFEGNRNRISNFYSRNTNDTAGANVGLFRNITAAASVRNLGVVDAHLYGSDADYNGYVGSDYVGSLVGINQGSINASYATGGTLNGGDGNDFVGSLVGWNEGSIGASYATGAVHGDAGYDRVGGLVGYNNQGHITASYATGAVHGGDGNDYVGGLVGKNDQGRILASYATGDADGGAGAGSIGGLVGKNDQGRILASYATGDADGGAGDGVYVGGLVGYNEEGSIGASYATGNSNGGSGRGYDYSGALVGQHWGTITHSYGFGIVTNASAGGEAGTAHPDGLAGISGKAGKVNALTIGTNSNTDVDARWNDADEKTKGAWDFGNNSQTPALKYADYDGASGTDYCALFPAKIPGTNTTLICNTSLLPGQGR